MQEKSVSSWYVCTEKEKPFRFALCSKDGKNSNSQVVFGLLVSRGGYPLSYSLFNGSQYEGYTMIPIVDDFVQRFNLGKDFVVIAGAGLMSTKNVKLLRDGGYKYIIGARIKTEAGEIMEKIVATEHRNGVFNDISYTDGDRLIVGYSDERAISYLIETDDWLNL